MKMREATWSAVAAATALQSPRKRQIHEGYNRKGGYGYNRFRKGIFHETETRKTVFFQGSTSRRGFLQRLTVTGLAGASGSVAMSAGACAGREAPDAGEEGVLSLDALSGDWMRMSALGINPALNNFWGALQVTDNLLAVTELTFPPFSQGQHSGYLRIDGEELKADESRWYAYQILRRARTRDLGGGKHRPHGL